MNILLIGVLGALGVYLRYAIDFLFTKVEINFPLQTLIANIIGCFVAGMVLAFLKEKSQSVFLYPTLIGFCGGLTTFSSFALQSFNILENGEITKAISYIVLTLLLGLVVVYLGFKASSDIFFSKV